MWVFFKGERMMGHTMNNAISEKKKNRYLLDILARRDKHMDRVASYTEILLRELDARDCQEIETLHIQAMIIAARLHDVGKMMVDEKLLYNPNNLTYDERAEIRSHPIDGANFLKELFSKDDDLVLRDYAINAALFHHERWDGQGYPYGLAGTDIPFIARVVAVADVYDALREPRVYKEALPHLRVAAMIIQDAGKAFDPQVTEAFQAQNTAIERLLHELQAM